MSSKVIAGTGRPEVYQTFATNTLTSYRTILSRHLPTRLMDGIGTVWSTKDGARIVIEFTNDTKLVVDKEDLTSPLTLAQIAMEAP